MSLLLLFFEGGGTAEVAATRTGGGWLTPEQAAAQLRELKRQEKQEQDHRDQVKAKARELEETIANAYNKAIGKPVLKKALESVEAPAKFTPETVFEVGQEIAEKISKAIGPGRKFDEDRKRLEALERSLVEMENLLYTREMEDNRIAAMLLLAVI